MVEDEGESEVENQSWPSYEKVEGIYARREIGTVSL